jgi:hypothetical protein
MANVLFPTTIIDDFFDDPHAVRKLALSTKFYPNKDGRWPGARSNMISNIDHELFEHTASRILSIFYNLDYIENFNLNLFFQHIVPRYERTNPRNSGFIHRDQFLLGGIIYLNEEYEDGIGTSIYTPKKSWYCSSSHKMLSSNVNKIKLGSYKNKSEITDDELKMWNKQKDRFNETITVQNVFNRCLLFDGSTFHGVPNFGTKERLSMNIFLTDILFAEGYEPTWPMYRSSFT